MHPLTYLGLANAVCAGLLAVLAVVVGRCFRRPALTHCLWLLVLIKLVTPPLFALPLAWLPAAPATDSRVAVQPGQTFLVVSAALEPEPVGPPMPGDVWIEMEKARLAAKARLAVAQGEQVAGQGSRPEEARGLPTEAQAQNLGQGQTQGSRPGLLTAAPSGLDPEAPLDVPVSLIAYRSSTALPEPPSRTDVAAPVSVGTVLGVVWLVGSVLWFARSVRRLARFQRLLRHARPAPDHVQALAARLAARLGLRRCPSVLLLPAPLPPMIWAALGRPCVLLPARLLERLDEDQLAALLTHELAHVRRGDHWVRRLEFVALGLFWWYPLAWWARTRLQAEEEECCDAWVVEEVPARSYASAIVETVDFLASDLDATPALASGLGRCDSIKRRLTLILSGTAPKRLNLAGRLAVLAIALGLLPLLPQLARSEKKPEQQAASSEDPAKPRTVDPSNEALAFRTEPLNLTGSENQVAALAVSRDGRFLAAGTGAYNRPGEVRVWTIPDHKEVLIYGSAKGVSWVAFSPDGRYLASADYDGQAVIREFPSGKPVAVLPLDGPARLSFSPDGKRLVTVTEAKTIKVWDALTGAEILRRDNPIVRCYCVAWSPDGKFVAIGGGDLGQNNVPNEITIWDARTFQPAGKLLGHTGPVLSVAFSPDSKTLASGAIDATARLWRLEGFKALGTLEGHEDWVKALTFTPDGKTLITGSHDGTVRLWDVAKQMPLTRLDGHVAPTRSVAVSPDGKQIFSGGETRMLKVWDAATHRETAGYQLSPEPPGEPSLVLAMAYSPDGRTLATTHENGTISLRSATNGDLRLTLEGHTDAATCLLFSRDGKTLITGSSDQTIRLWDVETGKPLATLTGHTSWVYALALSPDGKTLASGGYDKTVRLWDLPTRKEKATLTGHKGAIRSLAFAPDSKTLASGAGDQTIKLWDLESRQLKATLTGHEGTVRSLAFAPDGKTIASGSEDATVRLWDAAGAVRAVLKGHNDKVAVVTFSPQGRYVVSASMDGTFRLWDATTGQPAQALNAQNGALTSMAWAPDGRFLVTAGFDRSIKLWIVTTGTLRMLTGHSGPVRCVAFSPDGRLILSGSGQPGGDKTLRLWDAKTGKEIRKIEGHPDQVESACFSPDGKRILSGCADKKVRLWDAETGQCIRVMEGRSKPSDGVSISPDGTRAAATALDNTVRLWDLETGQTLHVFKGHVDAVRGVVFTPDGKRLVSAGKDATVRIWDAGKGVQLRQIDTPREKVETLALSPDGKRVAVALGRAVQLLDLDTGKTIRQLDGHQSSVLAVAWSPDGKTVLTGSMDRSARLWDVATGRELHLFRGHRNWVTTVNFSPDGRRILTAGGGALNGEDKVPGNDFTIRVWPMPDTTPMAGQVLKYTVKLKK